MCVVRHAQITQSNKCPISLQNLKKEMSDEVDFLHADKHELIQIDSVILIGLVKHSQISQNSKLAMSYSISKKKLRLKLTFRKQENIKVS